jgi:hypothetical protein
MGAPDRKQLLEEQGLYVKKNVVSEALCSDIVRKALQEEARLIWRDNPAPEGGWSRYALLDGYAVQDHYPELMAIYQDQAMRLSEELDREVITSPYPQSAVNIKIYGPDTCQGWHYDSQPLTCLLYLTHGAATEVQQPEGVMQVLPEPGAMLIMEGRRMLHRVLENTGTDPRLTVPFNYYYPHDTYRPPEMDQAIYQNAPIWNNND